MHVLRLLGLAQRLLHIHGIGHTRPLGRRGTGVHHPALLDVREVFQSVQGVSVLEQQDQVDACLRQSRQGIRRRIGPAGDHDHQTGQGSRRTSRHHDLLRIGPRLRPHHPLRGPVRYDSPREGEIRLRGHHRRGEGGPIQDRRLRPGHAGYECPHEDRDRRGLQIQGPHHGPAGPVDRPVFPSDTHAGRRDPFPQEHLRRISGREGCGPDTAESGLSLRQEIHDEGGGAQTPARGIPVRGVRGIRRDRDGQQDQFHNRYRTGTVPGGGLRVVRHIQLDPLRQILPHTERIDPGELDGDKQHARSVQGCHSEDGGYPDEHGEHVRRIMRFDTGGCHTWRRSRMPWPC